ncbi:hypothetical protein LINPERHAP2_LOCUS35925 [Linum perenne]
MATLFVHYIEDYGFLDLGFICPRYTWFRVSFQECLDRGLASISWKSTFPEATIHHLPRLRSDHRPILVNFFGLTAPCKLKRPFRFIILGMANPDFPCLLSSMWKSE